MDFESCINDCCMACNSLCPNFRSYKIQGQGDCKNSIHFQQHQITWEKEKNSRNKFPDEMRFGFKEEQQKSQLNSYCNCLSQSYEEDFPDKIRHESKCEKNLKIFQNYKNPWNSSYANWSNNKIKESKVFEESRNNEHFKSDNVDAETITELKEKVDFLFKAFKDYNPKVLSDSYKDKSHEDYVGIMSEDVSHLFNINKRLSVAEKSIQKLTLILENLLKDLDKRKACFTDKNLIFNEPLNFEDMPIMQRITLLKNRNDFLFNFIRDFLQVHSVEALYSTMDIVPKDCESNENPSNASVCFIEENSSNNFNTEDIMETLQELKAQISEGHVETFPKFDKEYSSRIEKRRENSPRCYKNKLEVISEQAELSFFYEDENEDSNNFSKKSNGHIKEKLTELKQESVEKNLNASEKTARLLAQEAMLKSSLDKEDFKIFLNQDSSEKNLSLSKNKRLHLNTENANEESIEGDTETSLDSSRSFYWERNNSRKYKDDNSTRKFRTEENKKEIKKGRNVEYTSSLKQSLPKGSFSKDRNKVSEAKNQSPSKVSHQKLLPPSGRAQRNVCCSPETCSFSREETRKEVKVNNQRPMTSPGCFSRTFQTSGNKASVPEKSRKKNSGIDNVKNKNKLLLNQKSCVRTA